MITFHKPFLCILTVMALLLTGCEKTPEDIQQDKDRAVALKAKNDNNIKNPTDIGTTTDGQLIKRITLKYECKREDRCSNTVDHFIYFVGSSTSNNYQIQSGKTVYDEVQVSLGQNPTPEQVIAEGERIKKAIDDADRKEYDRLKLKFEH